MTATSQELKDIVASLLSSEVDCLLQSTEFERRGRSLRYLRKGLHLTCVIEFKVFVRPSYAAPDSHLSVDYLLISPEVMQLARKMVSQEVGLGTGDVMLRRPIDWLRPSGAALWKFHDSLSLLRHSAAITESISQHILPYAERMASLGDYIAAQLEMFSLVEESRSPEIYSLAAAILLSAEEDHLALQLLDRFIGGVDADRIFDAGIRCRG